MNQKAARILAKYWVKLYKKCWRFTLKTIKPKMNQYYVGYSYRDSYGSYRGGHQYVDAISEQQAIETLSQRISIEISGYRTTYTVTLVKQKRRKLP